MASIYRFPGVDGPVDGEDMQRKAAPMPPAPDAAPDAAPGDVPAAVLQAVESVRAMPRIEGVSYREIGVPATLCAYGIGVSLSCAAPQGATPPRSGWVMALYDERRHVGDRYAAARSPWRFVAFLSVPLTGPSHSALTADMAWDAALETLHPLAAPGSVDGTVTVTHNARYEGGATATAHTDYGCEIRVSWTPATMDAQDPDAGAHIAAWARFASACTVE